MWNDINWALNSSNGPFSFLWALDFFKVVILGEHWLTEKASVIYNAVKLWCCLFEVSTNRAEVAQGQQYKTPGKLLVYHVISSLFACFIVHKANLYTQPLYMHFFPLCSTKEYIWKISQCFLSMKVNGVPSCFGPQWLESYGQILLYQRNS